MRECLIIGGGAVGLSLAYELSGHGWSVEVVDRRQPGLESSWAGAGLLPPCLSRIGAPALDSMVTMSNRLHRVWATKLLDETGIDNEYNPCGALLLATSDDRRTKLRQDVAHWHAQNIRLEPLDTRALAEIEPALASERVLEAHLAPDEVQLRNPRHLKALMAACRQRGVQIRRDVEVTGFEQQGGRVTAAIWEQGRIESDAFCICGGAWSTPLLAQFGVRAAVKPIRGQIVLLKADRPIVRHVIYDGSHYYLVPRADGHILIGSTVEDVGFDKSTTTAAVAAMLEFAHQLVPELTTASVEQCWAGLRPATADGLPYMGRVPDAENCFVAAGHFRCGLQLSTSTAVLMRQLMSGDQPEIDLAAFAVDREAVAIS